MDKGESSKKMSPLMLPRVSKMSPSLKQKTSIHRFMQVLANKKNHYQQELTKQQKIQQNGELYYIHRHQQDGLDQVQMKNRQRLRTDYLARGSTIEQTVEGRNERKKKMLQNSVVGLALHAVQQQQKLPSKLKRYRNASLNIQSETHSQTIQKIKGPSAKKIKVLISQKQQAGVEEQLPAQQPQSSKRYTIKPFAKEASLAESKIQLIEEKAQIKLDAVETAKNQSKRQLVDISSNTKKQKFQPRNEEISEFKRDQASQTIDIQRTSPNQTAQQSRLRQITHSVKMSSLQSRKIPRRSTKNRTQSQMPLSKPQQNQNKQLNEILQSLKRGNKTTQRLQNAISLLQKSNPMFLRLQRVVGVCLLRIGRIKSYQPQQRIYRMQESYPHFFIILEGRVKIKGRYGMTKISQTGQTLLQQILSLSDSNSKPQPQISLQKAKALSHSWLLEVIKSDFEKLQEQLVKFGFRQALNQLLNLIKRNQIVKNWLRNKFKISLKM